MADDLKNALPVLEYSRAKKRGFLTTTAVIAVLGGAVSFLNFGMTCCICGHQSLDSLPGNLMGMGLAIWAFARGGGWGDRVLAMLVVIYCAMVLAFNVHNVLWSGHDPLLR